MNILNHITEAQTESLIQFVKYAFAGGAATGVHIIIFHLFAWKLFPSLQENDFAVSLFKLSLPEIDNSTRSRNSMIDNALAFIFSNMVAYILNIFFVFERGRHCFFVEVSLFYLVSGISVAIGTFLMGFLIKQFKMRTTYAFLANIFSSVMINYVVRKYFIFSG